jgi:uncharacterized protein
LTDQQINISANHRTVVPAACAVIIFVRHPQLGRVKTRLASTMGDEKAMAIYKILLQHTYSLIQNSTIPVYVYYTDNIVQDDLWQGKNIIKKQQNGTDLGSRISNAFSHVFAAGHQKVIIIGSDCYELTAPVLIAAFNTLEQKDAVIGPAADGGYYLLGLKKMLPAVFENIRWSTDSVKDETINILKEHNYTFSLLQTLTDVDEEKDLPQAIKDQL